MDCGEIALKNFRSSKVLPVARYRYVIDSLSLTEIASLIAVFCFWICGVTSYDNTIIIQSSKLYL